MIKLLARIGRATTVAIVTLLASLASIAVTSIGVLALDLAGLGPDWQVALILAAGVPLVVTPLLSWYLIGLLLRIYRIEEEMRSLASHDSLTGLLSRHAFFDRAANYVSLARRDQTVFSVLLADLDHFKSINDRFGHPAGDAVLKLFADVVNSVARRSDIVGRIGGEEFAMLLPSTGKAEALEFSNRLHAAIDKAVLKHQNRIIEYTASIGVAASDPAAGDSAAGDPAAGDSLDGLLAQADRALYEAKRDGRNRTVVARDSDRRAAAS